MSLFEDIAPIQYVGPDSDTASAFRWYDKHRLVRGRTMEDHLRMAVCYWHTFCWDGADMFGRGTLDRAWQRGGDLAHAEEKAEAAFAFMSRLGAPYFCFHDVDVAPEGASLAEFNRNLDHMADVLAAGMANSGIKLLWGTANLFSHKRYMAGAATNPDPEIFAFAAGQVAHVLETTHRLGGENYVLWGGREGYDTLHNTDLKRESDQLGRFLSMVVEHKHKLGFKGAILIEPKPMEPTKHQYDHDVATVLAFLRKYDLGGEVKLNIEANHATLAGHSFEHEIALAVAEDALGSIDINRGDPQNGWDTDQFAIDEREVGLVLAHILAAGGLGSGGFNFDAKLRRQSIDPVDLFHAHVGGMDTLARGLLVADRLLEEGALSRFREQRYRGWEGELGQAILTGATSLAELKETVHAEGIDPLPVSGRQEMLENLVSRAVERAR